MDVIFERGNKEKPKGHACLYFRSAFDPEEAWGTYLVILPITVDVSKYVPPFLMNQLGGIGPKDLSAFAFPPAPEKLESRRFLEELAALREDDIIFGGRLNPNDIPSAMMAVSEAVQWYSNLYNIFAESRQPAAASGGDSGTGFGVNEVLYGLMSDGDKLSELTKLVGRLRFAADAGERSLMQEAEADINLLAAHLPEDNQVAKLVAAAKSRDSNSGKLAELYLQRCFHLLQQEYVKLGKVEAEIRVLEAGGTSV